MKLDSRRYFMQIDVAALFACAVECAGVKGELLALSRRKIGWA